MRRRTLADPNRGAWRALAVVGAAAVALAALAAPAHAAEPAKPKKPGLSAPDTAIVGQPVEASVTFTAKTVGCLTPKADWGDGTNGASGAGIGSITVCVAGGQLENGQFWTSYRTQTEKLDHTYSAPGRYTVKICAAGQNDKGKVSTAFAKTRGPKCYTHKITVTAS